MCWCTPEKRTPVCDDCPPEVQAKWNKPVKKIGIVCDKYKVKKFLAALTEAGFAEVEEVGPLFKKPDSPIVITVDNVPDDRVDEVHRLCKKLEIDFKRSN